MNDEPETKLEALAREAAARSLTLRLDYHVDQTFDLVAPGGTTPETHRAGMVLFGPVTWTVLWSLWAVGYPARREELEEIRNAARAAMKEPTRHAPSGEQLLNIHRPLALWRMLAALSQLVEEVAALTTALAEWHSDGYPRSLRCVIGERYLRWSTTRDGSLGAALAPFADPGAVFSLLSYPDAEEATMAIGKKQGETVCRLAQESAALAAGGFRALAAAITPALARTFVRYKHRITATSPTSAPIWLPPQTAANRAVTDKRFDSGFGVLDWAPRGSQPELILWPAEDRDLQVYNVLMSRAYEILGLLLASVVRFGSAEVDALPLLMPVAAELKPTEAAAIKALDASDYRTVAMARRHA